MPKFETRRRVPHTARQMYDLVADVERYPQFLPLCKGLRVRSRTPRPDDGNGSGNGGGGGSDNTPLESNVKVPAALSIVKGVPAVPAVTSAPGMVTA